MELPKAIRYSVRLDNTEVLSSSRISLVIENRDLCKDPGAWLPVNRYSARSL